MALFAGQLGLDFDGWTAEPSAAASDVRAAISEQLRTFDCRVGFTAAASGPDVVFLEAILELGGEAHVVLPYEQGRFLKDDVAIEPGSAWTARWEQALRRASRVVIASPRRLVAGSTTYDYADLVLRGLARNRAFQLDTELTPLVLRQVGRTTLGSAQRRGVSAARRPVEVVLLDDVQSTAWVHSNAADARAATADTRPVGAFSTEIVAMLFADAVGFSKLTDEEVPRFVEQFLDAVARLADRSLQPPLTRNTWGDGLYFVFPSVRDAGLFALDLRDLVTDTDWAEKGLPNSLSLRIGLHAGPVYRCIEPVTKQINYIGAHVSRAARIEPITPPGQVYASQGFAALAAATGVDEFSCDYVGQTPLAKGYGTFPTYHVRRR